MCCVSCVLCCPMLCCAAVKCVLYISTCFTTVNGWLYFSCTTAVYVHHIPWLKYTLTHSICYIPVYVCHTHNIPQGVPLDCDAKVYFHLPPSPASASSSSQSPVRKYGVLVFHSSFLLPLRCVVLGIVVM